MKPIFFNTEMVEAILYGCKTVTRRLVRPQPQEIYGEGAEFRMHKSGCHKGEWHCYRENPPLDRLTSRPWGGQIKPLYQAGDTLYVRETWCKRDGVFYYKAAMNSDALKEFDELGEPLKWKPSIHMPKDAARIFLKVKDVSAERLQDITEQDVKAEGTDMDAWYEHDEWQHAVGDSCVDDGISVIFETLKGFFGHHHWDMTLDSFEKIEKYGWDANPWVWVMRFERCGKQEGEA